MNRNRSVVSYGLFIEEGVESVKPCPPVTADHLEKSVQDAQVPGASKLSEAMVTGVSTDSGPSVQSPISLTSTTSLLATVPANSLQEKTKGGI